MAAPVSDAVFSFIQSVFEHARIIMNLKTSSSSTLPMGKPLTRRFFRPKQQAQTGILPTQDLRRIVAEMLG
ncbi:hypothetical protein SAMN02927924_03586 [Sphingobium faniae]|nr:hypothetical protein SAMN02927924_03586 [Sphingobium faniae]